MEQQKSRRLVVIGVVILVIGVAFGIWYGAQKLIPHMTPTPAARPSENFPKPPAELHTLTGTILQVVGASIYFNVDDPTDYLPHADGTPPRQQTRVANLTKATTITLVDPTKLAASGTPTVTTLTLKDLKPKMGITVTSDQNILSAPQFDVTAIKLIKS